MQPIFKIAPLISKRKLEEEEEDMENPREQKRNTSCNLPSPGFGLGTAQD